MTIKSFDSIRENITQSFKRKFEDNDRQFFARVYAPAPTIYTERLRAVGFDDCTSILDAGCGFGQWSVCMADLGATVLGVDASPLRVQVANRAFQLAQVSAQACVGNLKALPVEAASMDGVFCYGTLFCTPWKESLAEFARILRPGGRLYFSANDIGYILNMWTERPNRASDFDPRQAAANTFINTLAYEKNRAAPENGQILITPEEARFELDQLGFEVVSLKPEGTINLHPNQATPKPFFKAEYMGLPGCYEVLAEKRRD